MTEILIVLMVFLLLSAIGLNLYPHFFKGMENKMFLNQLNEDIFYAQQYAMSHESLIYFYVDEAREVYTIHSYKEEGIVERAIPKDVRISKGTLGATFYFNQYGNPSKSGTMTIDTTNGKYKLVVHIGKGRFRIEKQ